MRLSDLKLPEKNARFLKGPVFAQLVANIKQDGCLTSFPLVNRQGEDLTVASGSHRVAAAMKAGLVEHDVIEITSPLTREQFVALQLSHNAIVGEDDPNVLRSLYDELGFEWKEYSGLTDDAFKVEDLDMSVLRVEAPFYEELFISFLPGDAAIFGAWLDKIAKSKSAASHGRALCRLRPVLRAVAGGEARHRRPQHGGRAAADGGTRRRGAGRAGSGAADRNCSRT